MSTIKKILVPFDFLEASYSALDYAMSFVGYDKPISIVALWVSEVKPTEHELEELYSRFTSTLNEIDRTTHLKPRLITRNGKLTDTILSTFKEEQFDLILMGTMGDEVAEDAITHTSRLVLEAEGPVLTIPFGTEAKPPQDIALVLGREEIEDTSVLELLLDISRLFNARVHVLTIYKGSIYEEEMTGSTSSEKNEETLEYFLEHFYEEHVFTKNQDVEKGIFDYVEEKNIDLLAILPRNHAEKTSPSEGRLTKLLSLHSKVPVLALD